jgi:hypothetical protein
MTSSPEPPGYLEEAVDELRKARDANETRAALIPSLAGAKVETGPVLAEVNARRMELGLAFLVAAAIERGLPPCCHGVRAEPGQEQS